MHVDAKITSKNQITLPRAVRERLGVAPGGRVRFEIGDDGGVRVMRRTGSFEDLRGMIDIGRSVSTEEILEMVQKTRDEIGLHGRNGSSDDAES